MPHGTSQCAAASSLGKARWVAAITRSTRFIDVSPQGKLRDPKSVPHDSMGNENTENGPYSGLAPDGAGRSWTCLARRSGRPGAGAAPGHGAWPEHAAG